MILGLILVFSVLSVAFLGTVVDQVRAMTMSEPALEGPAVAALFGALGLLPGRQTSDPGIVGVRMAFRATARGSDNTELLEAMRKRDPANSVYQYLELLQRLRRLGSTATQPAAESELSRILRDLENGPPAKLYLARQRPVAFDVLASHGVPPRRAAAEADRLPEAVHDLFEYHRPVLRELRMRLLELGQQWRAGGRRGDALLADRAALRLHLDLLADSPTGDVALLAAESGGLPAILSAIAEDEPALASTAGAAIRAAGELAPAWRAAVPADDVNFIPWTGDRAIARPEHRRLMHALLASCLALCDCAMLAVIAIVLLLIVAVTPKGGNWIWRGATSGGGPRATSRLLAPAIVAAPVFVLVGFAAFANLPLVWLISSLSIHVLVFSPFVLLAILGLAGRLATTAPGDAAAGEQFGRARISIGGLVRLLIAFAACLVVLALLVPIRHEPWRPPVGVQWLRKFGALAELVCGAFVVIWIVWGQIRLRRAGLPAGVLARVQLGIVSRALLACLMLAVICLWSNQVLDRRHQAAFVRASADVAADRLGPDWQSRFFGPAQGIYDKARR